MRLFPALAFALVMSAFEPSKRLESVTVQDATGGAVRFALPGKFTVVTFISTTCPISNDYNDRMAAVYRDYSGKGVQFLFVNANSNEPLSTIRDHAKAAEFPFPVYKDVANVLADQLGATVTPETFVLDRDGAVRYRGQIEDSRNPARTQVRGLRSALDQLLEGSAVTKLETKAFGCTIKRVKKIS